MIPVSLLRIVVASPSDVQREREAVEEIVEELNHSVALHQGMMMVVGRWEIDAYPGFHPEGPQGLIDPILRIEECDLLVGIFWKRLGTKGPDGTTGTEHEFLTAFNAWQEKGRPQIMAYFSQKKSTVRFSDEDLAQLEALQAFQERFPKQGMWWNYSGTDEFKKLFRVHLTNFLHEFNRP